MTPLGYRRGSTGVYPGGGGVGGGVDWRSPEDEDTDDDGSSSSSTASSSWLLAVLTVAEGRFRRFAREAAPCISRRWISAR